MNAKDALTVEQVYQLDADEIHLRAGKSDYWGEVESFWEKNKTRLNIGLSENQKAWLNKIAQDLEKELAR